MNIIETLEREEIARLNKTVPDFAPGDTVIVNVNVVEGERKRVQAYEGVVIAKRNRGLNSSFTVRKISSGEGVERTFQTYSPLIASIEIKRKGDVRRAKLYYLRGRSGKSARIREKLASRESQAQRTTSERVDAPRGACRDDASLRAEGGSEGPLSAQGGLGATPFVGSNAGVPRPAYSCACVALLPERPENGAFGAGLAVCPRSRHRGALLAASSCHREAFPPRFQWHTVAAPVSRRP